jgi:hypothetical protein
MLPVLATLSTVTHIGTLDPTHKGIRGPSQEGLGVSFSCHPHAWEAIAKLGGQAWFNANVSHLAILDGHAFVQRNADALRQWGQENGWVTAVQAYQVSWFDDELESQVHMLCATREEAQAELRDEEEPQALQVVPALAPTRRLVEAMGAPVGDIGQPGVCALDDLATVWAQAHDLDGVWWEDAYDPDALSAPRGVIFPHRLDKVDFVPVSPAASRKLRR